MLKLMKLEWKKYKVWKYIIVAGVAALLTLGLMALMSTGESNSLIEIVEQTGYSVAYSITELFVNMTYLVFSATILSTFIVSSYKNKTMNIMFSYPINRKKIIAAKILDVCLFAFICAALSKLLIYGVLFAVGIYTTEIIPIGTLDFWLNQMFGTVLSIGCGCIALVFGMKFKSSKLTVLLSFGIMLAVMAITTGNSISCLSVLGIVGYIIEAVAIGVSIFFSIYNVEKKDVV